MTLTSRLQMAVAALTGAVVGYLLVGGFDLANQTIPVTPWSLPMMLFAFGLAAAGYARVLRRQVRDERPELDDMAAVRALVLGKALLMTGLVTAGGHLVYALRFIRGWEVEGPRERVIRGLVTLGASLVLAWAGWLLERTCVAPGEDLEEPGSRETTSTN